MSTWLSDDGCANNDQKSLALRITKPDFVLTGRPVLHAFFRCAAGDFPPISCQKERPRGAAQTLTSPVPSQKYSEEW
jgi:hypothetical protein